MAEEKKRSFAEMFKSKKADSDGSTDSSNNSSDSSGDSSVLNKFGIKKKDFLAGRSSLASKIASQTGESSKNSTEDSKSKVIARKNANNEKTFAQNIENGRSDLVFLVRGKDGVFDAWHYVYIDKLKKAMFLAAAKTGSLDVADYGTVLYSGWGKDPPEEIVRKIKLRFNIS